MASEFFRVFRRGWTFVGQEGCGVFPGAPHSKTRSGLLGTDADEHAPSLQVLPWRVVQRVGFVGARSDFACAEVFQAAAKRGDAGNAEFYFDFLAMFGPW